MPYERRLEIPRELYRYGEPYTMHIWPSIFKGVIVRHPDFIDDNKRLRIKIRHWLVDHDIRWRRDDLNLTAWGVEVMTPVFRIVHPYLINSLLDDVLISDHGCDPVEGAYTEIAYLGSNNILNARSVLDVRADLYKILSKNG